MVQRTISSNDRVLWVDLMDPFDPTPAVTGRDATLLPQIPLRRFPTIDVYLDRTGSS